jgi:hypothetical protein
MMVADKETTKEAVAWPKKALVVLGRNGVLMRQALLARSAVA